MTVLFSERYTDYVTQQGLCHYIGHFRKPLYYSMLMMSTH